MLDERTLQLMAEAFAEEKCVICGEDAKRRHHGKFYCHSHAPGRRKESTIVRDQRNRGKRK